MSLYELFVGLKGKVNDFEFIVGVGAKAVWTSVNSPTEPEDLAIWHPGKSNHTVDGIKWSLINSSITRRRGNIFNVRYKEMTEDKR